MLGFLARPVLAQTYLSPVVGVNFSKMVFKNPRSSAPAQLPTTHLTGFRLGIAYKEEFDSVFSYRSSFLVSTKGFRNEYDYEDDGQITNDGLETWTMYYFQSQLSIHCRPEIYGKNILSLGVGAYLGFGITGEIEVEETLDDQVSQPITTTSQQDLAFTSWEQVSGSYYPLYPLDAGLLVRLALEPLDNLQIAFLHEWGLVNAFAYFEDPDNNAPPGYDRSDDALRLFHRSFSFNA